MNLDSVRYASDNYGDVVGPKDGGPSAKYTYLANARKYLKILSKTLGAPRRMKDVVSTNPGGFAVPGDASLRVFLEDGREIYVFIHFDPLSLCSEVVLRLGEKPYASDGANLWLGRPAAAEVSTYVNRFILGEGHGNPMSAVRR